MTYRGYILRGATALYLTLFYSPATGSEWGLRAGGRYGATELADGLGFGLSGFVRRPLSPRYHIEFGGGYGRLRSADYTTDLAVAEGRRRYAWGRGQCGCADINAGAGARRYDLADSPPQTTPDADAIGWSTTAPVDIGIQRPLGPGRRLDLDLGYTYTLRDDINRAILEKGNDGYWSLTVGLVFGGADPARSLPRAESTATSAATPTAPSVAETARAADGLPLVVRTLPLGQTYGHLHQPSCKIHAGRHQRHPPLHDLSNQLANLTLVQQELPPTQRLVCGIAAMTVGTDVDIVEIALAIF